MIFTKRAKPRMKNKVKTDVLVIGGGPAGMMACSVLKERGRRVVLLEKNDRLGRKLLITGKGRCNVTNNCSSDELIKATVTGGRFLYSAFSSFSSADTMKFFEERGVSLKTERGNRVFPVSDKASTILEAMKRSLGKTEIIYESAISVKEGFLVETENYIIESESVIIASGGASYQRTGSSGDGYNFAEKLGHSIVPIKPALIPIVTREKDAAEMQGLSLKNVVLSLYKKDKKKPIYSEMGEMLFTHFGLSGPLVLTASCYIKDNPEDYKVEIDLKPALSREALHKRILRDFEENKNKALSNVLPLLLPRAMIPVIIKRIGVDPLKKINGITGAEREALVENMKAFSFEVSSLRPIEEAIITSGGIKTNEIDPKTMESKICRGLYFAGEVIDVNALTGGFNLQIAFSTGYTAGMNA